MTFARIILHRSSRLTAAASLVSACLLAFSSQGLIAQDAAPLPEAPHRHAIAMHGAPALLEGYAAFPYVNPDAPKGGTLRIAGQGSFDSINSMSIRGSAPQALVPYVVQPLMMRSLDEPFTLYALLAQTIAVPDDRGFVEFRLNPKARFADGTPVQAKDVEFSWHLFTERGHPNYRRYAKKVAHVTLRDARTIRFTFFEAEAELPLILGLMPILPAHAVDPERFDSMGFTPFLGSGPYLIEKVEPGTSVTLRRRPDYWGLDLPAHRGMYNFDTLNYEFFRDSNTLFEAFKTGLYDIRVEIDPAKWLQGYDFPAARDGRVIREDIALRIPKDMSGFAFNTRRAPFDDPRIREALFFLFDFEWLNKNLFANVYKRTASYFEGSELAFTNGPADAREIPLLDAAPDGLPAAIRAGTWRPPVSDGSGRDRAVIRQAVALLREAGYAIQDGAMVKAANGEPFSFEIMVTTREHERIALAFADGLKQVGITPRIRLVDSSQYWSRLKAFNFDVIIQEFRTSASPGNEQVNRWSSAAADTPASFNRVGVKSPAIDAALQALLAARSRDDLVGAARALDRLLVAGHYMLPLYHLPARWVARWRHISRPKRLPTYEFTSDIFWFDANR